MTHQPTISFPIHFNFHSTAPVGANLTLAQKIMKRKLQLAIGALVLALLGGWIYWAQLGVRSTTFAGPA